MPVAPRASANAASRYGWAMDSDSETVDADQARTPVQPRDLPDLGGAGHDGPWIRFGPARVFLVRFAGAIPVVVQQQVPRVWPGDPLDLGTRVLRDRPGSPGESLLQFGQEPADTLLRGWQPAPPG